MDKLFMQFLGELRYCNSWYAVQQVATQFFALAKAEYEQQEAAKSQQPNEGSE
jgi:hypothetical protein